MKTPSMKQWLPFVRRNLLRSTGFGCLGMLLVGCPASNQSPTPEPASPTGKLVIRGSNTVGEELAPKLTAAFKKDNPAAEFDTEFKGSGYGIGALAASKCDIAASSRPILKQELEIAQMRSITVNDAVIGAYSVAVIVHNGSSVTNLTKQQVQDIFTGKIQNWKDVGGQDAPMKLHIRDTSSGTQLGFRELAMSNEPYPSAPNVPNMLPSYEEIVAAVAKDPNAIGYCGLTEVSMPGIKGVSIGGIAPTVASVHKGDYPYARTLHLYTNKARESKDARAFIDFVLSATGQKILTDMGFVPKP